MKKILIVVLLTGMLFLIMFNNIKFSYGIIEQVSNKEIKIQIQNDHFYLKPMFINASFKKGDFVKISYFNKLSKNQPTKIINLQKTEDLSKIIPTEWNDILFKEYHQQAYTTLLKMTLEEKIGQMILSRFPENSNQAIQEYHVGGFILFKKDFEKKTKEEIIYQINQLQDSSKIPLFLAVDEEGGTVVRISSNPNLRTTPFLSPRQIYNTSGLTGIEEDTEEKIKLLKELGINLNLAPVADVSVDSNDYIYERSLGESALETSKYIKAVVKIYNEEKMGCALKHFPGYGSNKDTHQGISIDNRSYSEFTKKDFLPFQAGIEEKVPSILVSHNIVTSMDSNYPASLSKNVHDILKNKLHFRGVIMTDELSMKAIQEYTNNPILAAIESGNDLLLVTDYEQAYHDIMNSVENGKIKEERINESVFKILAWKYELGILK